MGRQYLGFSELRAYERQEAEQAGTLLGGYKGGCPWEDLITLIEPHDTKSSKKGSRPPYLLATTQRINVLQ